MILTATLTQKGQVTIPLSIRKALNLQPYKKVFFEVKEDSVEIIKPNNDFLSLIGSVKTPKNPQDFKTAFKKKYEKKFKGI